MNQTAQMILICLTAVTLSTATTLLAVHQSWNQGAVIVACAIIGGLAGGLIHKATQ